MYIRKESFIPVIAAVVLSTMGVQADAVPPGVVLNEETGLWEFTDEWEGVRPGVIYNEKTRTWEWTEVGVIPGEPSGVIIHDPFAGGPEAADLPFDRILEFPFNPPTETTPTQVTTPEPGTLALLTVGALAAVRRRRRGA